MHDKVLFFDIDGTLIDFHGNMPDRTKDALLEAKERNNHIVICTGRCRCQIYPSLLELGFNGVIGSTGAYVEAAGREIYHHTMDREQLAGLLGYLDSRKIVYLLQTRDFTVTSPECRQKLRHLMLEELHMTPERLERLLGMMELDEQVGHRTDIEKLVYYNSPENHEKVRLGVGNAFDVVALSFDRPDDTKGEITSAGVNKASGMKHYLEAVGAGAEDAVAFGDGANDFDMIRYAGISVVMGNGIEALKKEATMVTDRIEQNGIYNAMRKLQLIGS